MQHFDMVIVGGGMVGLALASALADTDIRIAVINSRALKTELTKEPELRVSAINQANRIQFEAMGVWDEIEPNRVCNYRAMHVWDQDSFGEIDFHAKDLQLQFLGAIVENQALVNALAKQVEYQGNVTVFENTKITELSLGESQHAIVLDGGGLMTASLIVGADGANSFIRKTAKFPVTLGDYGQTAIVATVRSELPHDGVARQVFTPFGPLALLPLADPLLCSIVWSQDTAETLRVLALADSEFNKELSVVSNHSLGRFEKIGESQSFSLSRQYARQWVDTGVVLCGDAAHTFHPLAGQGANLGFEDAWCLAKTLKSIAQRQSNHIDFRSPWEFREYERSRKAAAVKMIAAMEGFHQAFTGSNKAKKGLRGLALAAANAISPIKKELAKQALGI